MIVSTETFKDIQKAKELLEANPHMKKVDGDGWSIYRVGSNLVRIDIKVSA